MGARFNDVKAKSARASLTSVSFFGGEKKTKRHVRTIIGPRQESKEGCQDRRGSLFGSARVGCSCPCRALVRPFPFTPLNFAERKTMQKTELCPLCQELAKRADMKLKLQKVGRKQS